MISVIMPVYNTSKFLRQAIEAVLSQTYEDFELILVNDGSTDDSGAICDKYAITDPRIRVIHKPNGGLSSARNAGLDAARGDYILFPDSDDYIMPDMLMKLISASDGTTEDVVVCDGVNVIDDEISDAHLVDGLRENNYENQLEYIVFARSAAVWNKLFGRSTMGDVRFDTNYTISEDLIFFLGMFSMVKRVCVIPDKLYCYRMNRKGSILNAKWSSRFEQFLDAYDIAVKSLIKHNCKVEAATRIRMCVGRTLRAVAGAKLSDSRACRAHCKKMLFSVSPIHLLKERRFSVIKRIVSVFQYGLSAISPTLIVQLFKLRRKYV